MKLSFFISLLLLFSRILLCEVDKTTQINFYTIGLDSNIFRKYDEECKKENIEIKSWKYHNNILKKIGYVYPDTNVSAEYFTLDKDFLDQVKNAEQKECIKGWNRLYGIFFIIIEDDTFPYIAIYDKDYFDYENPKNKDWGKYFHKKYEPQLYKDGCNRVWIYYKAGIEDQVVK